MRLVNDRVELFLRELRRVDVIGGRKDAAAGARLDDVGAVFVVKADRFTCLICAVDNTVDRPGLGEKALAESRCVIETSALCATPARGAA